MSPQEQHFRILFQHWLENTATAQEREEFERLVMISPDNEHLLAALSEEWKKDYEMPLPEQLFQKIMENTKIKQVKTLPVVHRVHFLRTAWFRVAVAILLFSSVGAYLWLRNPKPGLETVTIQPVPVQNDVAPGGNKAILTLADGSVINLDSAIHGKLAQQSGATIQKSANGEIIYAFDKTSLANSVSYNTMSTPRGGTYQLILPDGSKVWLNAESSITFPTVFTGNTRELKMTGEVYFEIKSDKQKPFIVKTISDEIQVLGTSFNINAYNDEPVKTSLLEGKVKVNTAILKPGFAYQDKKIRPTNMEQDIAWKKGIFNFKDLPAEAALKQLARWYDVDIKYENGMPGTTLGGEMGRNLSLQQVLKGLEGVVAHFRLEGKTLYVSSL